MGEKFTANPATGTGSVSIPIPASPGRSGGGLQVALSYDTAAGNGIFGLGWGVDLPAISRKTDKGLPRYDDGSESDVFLLSGAEDLVPAVRLTNLGDVELDGHGLPVPDVDHRDGYRIVRYRPRVEGLFARIERWTSDTDRGEVFWRVITRDNATSLYGRDPDSRIVDPADASHIFAWLICESYDDQGNGVQYEYKKEDGRGVAEAMPTERQRRDVTAAAQRYIKTIRYGNVVSRLHPDPPGDWRNDWLFEIVFDYGEGHYTELPLDAGTPADEQHRFSHGSRTSTGEWHVRPDPFSSYRAGFEVRTYRRCERVLMFHLMKELGPEPCLVRALELDYSDFGNVDAEDYSVGKELHHHGSTRFASFLTSVTQCGYEPTGPEIKEGPHDERYLRYLRQSLPPLTLRYSKPTVDSEIRTVDTASVANLPMGLGGEYEWADLDAEGVAGILTEQGGAWWYKRNKGGGRLGGLELISSSPNASSEGRRLLDLSGNGSLDLVDFAGGAPGFYERSEDRDWVPHRSFASLPNVRWDDPNLRFVDLDGDGLADIMVTEDDALMWYQSLAENGFGSGFRTVQPFDERLGPRLMFADGTKSVHLADMSGDGLSDLVRITNGEVCYWPNLGYGRFGSCVVMDNPPQYDHEEQFNQDRIRLADIDGSGVTDIIYLGRRDTRVYFNQSGNRWTDAVTVVQFPLTDATSSVSVVDLMGTGTACLVWSSPLPVDSPAPMKYIDLMAHGKPHLLVEARNNFGADTLVHYVPSTKFYLADETIGEPWITRLPFPVYVVDRVDTVDRVSGHRFASRYEYHHGYYDGMEREFRGFGRVDQYDTEEYDLLQNDPEAPAPNLLSAAHVPPIVTRTWFHTGAYLGRQQISRLCAAEYYREPGLSEAQAQARLLPDTLLPDHLSYDEQRQACRALRGSMLRQEVYALDGPVVADYPLGHPYVVVEQNFAVRLIQPKGDLRHAVLLTHPGETLTYHYERNPADPRISHSLTLSTNGFGQVTLSADVAYPRRGADADLPLDLQAEQRRLLITHTETAYTNGLVVAADTPDAHRTPTPFDVRTHHLTGVTPADGQIRFTAEQLGSAIAAAAEIGYEQTPDDGAAKRLIEHQRVRYREDDLRDACDWGELPTRATVFGTYRLAFTAGLLDRTYRRPMGGMVGDLIADRGAVLPVDAAAGGDTATDRGGYVALDADGTWWVPSGRIFYSPGAHDTAEAEFDYARRHFFVPRRYRTPFHTSGTPTETSVAFDVHDLAPVATKDALANEISSEVDYRVLAPRMVTDVNGNRSAAAFDALGNVVATAVMGTADAAEGDELVGFTANLTPAQIRAAFDSPLTDPHQLIGHASSRMVYDLAAYQRSETDAQPAPVGVYTVTRETHTSELEAGAQSRLLPAFSYSDGFGRELQRKALCEPGRVPQRDAAGQIVVIDGQPQMTDADVAPRWVGSGWTEVNNKGNPIRQYEPFFSDTHRCDFDARIGVTKTLFYDPVGRVVAVLHPDHSYEKVVVGAWRQDGYDANDTVAPHGRETGDPRTDPDIAGLVRRYFARQDPAWRTWLSARQGAGVEEAEADAGIKASGHADTPKTTFYDSLGRAFLNRIHNGFASGGEPIHLDTRVVLDIEGNERAVVDAAQRTVMTFDYDILGNRTRQSSMEAGERWTLKDVAGSVIRAWDSRGHTFRTAYDAMRRQLHGFVTGSGEWSDPDTRGGELLHQRVVYGEGEPLAAAKNLRGRVFQQFDSAGIVTFGYDFKGNTVHHVHEIAGEHETAIDWAAPQAQGERFVSSTRYDALNRPVQLIAPHHDVPGEQRAIAQPVYNEAGLLEGLDVWTGRPADPADLINPAADAPSAAGVARIDYDAKGQRTLIVYRNGVTAAYEYDPTTYRLRHVYTRRDATFTEDCGGDPPPPRTAAPVERPPNVPCGLQNLSYTYDPAGNVTRVRDDAQQTVFFSNQVVEPTNDYTYDAIYQLIRATGREHVGQAAIGRPHSYNDAGRTGMALPGDPGAMSRYCETYEYDGVGNVTAMQHRKSCPGAISWSRTFSYDEDTQLNDRAADNSLRHSNRLTSSTVGGGATETYSGAGDGYDTHGNMLRMTQLQELEWNFRDHLRMTRRQAVNAEDVDGQTHTGERTYYVYGADGQRSRKVTVTAGGVLKEERIYLSGFEIYRKHTGQDAGLVRETIHVMDGGQRLALVDRRNDVDDGTPVEVIRYQLGNHLGSATLELDAEQQVISYEEYSPYGSTTYHAARSAIEVAAKRFRYTGKERDEESGLYYHGARYYAPWLGRWTACDPSGLVDGPNLYRYVRCNPTNLSDPTGRLSWGKILGIAAAVVVGTVVTVATAGLAGPLVGAATAGIIGGIVGGAAGGVVGEVVEAGIEGRKITARNVLIAGAIGAVAGGVFAGLGAAASAAFRTAVGRAVASRVASSFVGQVARRVAQSSFGKAVASAHRAIHEPAERAGQRLAQQLGVGATAKAAAAAEQRAAATAANVTEVPGVTREVAPTGPGDTFTHSVGWRGGGPFGPEATGAQVEASGALKLSKRLIDAQWGEGAYASKGGVGENPSGSGFQFEVPSGTAAETITAPGKRAIVRLVPPPGVDAVPIRITGTDFPPGALEQGRAFVQGAKLVPPRLPFGYPGLSADVSGLSGGTAAGADSLFFGPIEPSPDSAPTGYGVGVRF